MPDRLDHHPHQVDDGIHQVFVRLPVVRRAARYRQVGPDVLNCRLQPVQPVVEAAEIGSGHDALVGRHVQFVRTAAGLVGALTVRGTAELTGTARTGPR